MNCANTSNVTRYNYFINKYFSRLVFMVLSFIFPYLVHSDAGVKP